MKVDDIPQGGRKMTNATNLSDLALQVRQWAVDKGLDQSEPTKQMLKVTEEIGEVAGALAKNDDEHLKEEIGDAFVTLIILCLQKGVTPDECLNIAYTKIAKRKGQMINGVFIKQEDIGVRNE